MNKNLMSVAVAATILGASSAHAVFVNSEGHGQVLLYPYYTVTGGQDTYINLVNTTDQVKAVKVRFIEAMNSNEVLDFNLYMSPKDHWSGVVFATADGAALRTADTTCTVPNSLAATAEGVPGPAVPFRDFLFASDSVNGPGRTREGYVEVIEMGYLTDTTDITNATHVNGVPKNCAALAANWSAGGKWSSDANDDVEVPTGGLYGYGVLINVAEGTDATYDATALDGFADPLFGPLHAAPGTTDPSLSQAGDQVLVFDTSVTGNVIDTFAFDGLDAVSAVLMQASIENDYVLEQDIAAGTDWVVTFPTKREYTNGLEPEDPFTVLWDPKTSKACEPISIEYFDREERAEAPDPLDFSPQPPQSAFALCWEANVLTFNESDVLSPVNVKNNLNVDFENGWATINFDTVSGREIFTEDAIFNGLPAIGFAVQKYVNGELVIDGTTVLSNYAGLVNHKGVRSAYID